MKIYPAHLFIRELSVRSFRSNIRTGSARLWGVMALLAVLGLCASTASASSAAPGHMGAQEVASAQVVAPATPSVAVAPLVTSPARPSLVAAPHGPFNGARYYYQTICAEKRTEFWPIANAAQFFENSGAVDFSVSTACGGLTYQRLIIDDYAAADGTCVKTQATPVSHAGLPYYTWASTPILWMNAYYATCYNTPTRKAHMISRGIGYLLGLEVFNTAGYPYLSVMNDTTSSVDSVAWAQGFDRNGVFCRYLGCSAAVGGATEYRMSTDGKEYLLTPDGVTTLSKLSPLSLK